MSNPNTVSVWSPDGDMFEMSRANARDLTTHAGWSNSPPNADTAKADAAILAKETQAEIDAKNGQAEIAAAAEAAAVAAEKEAADAASSTTGSEGGDAEEGTGDEGSDEGTEGEGTEEEAVGLTVEDFEGMDRDAVVAYLRTNHPEYHPHHKTGIDKLIAKAIELSAGE